MEDPPTILSVLESIPLFDSLYLRMQATNIELVDGMIEGMEIDLAREMAMEDRTPIPSVAAVSAVSQMWVFAVYELLRTWRQRVGDLLRIADRVNAEHGTNRQAALVKEAEAIRGGDEGANPAFEMQRSYVLRLEDDGFVTALREAERLLEPIFREVEGIRITLAKHEIPKSRGLVARSPGYGRVDYMTGSIYWEFEVRDGFVEVVRRREIADHIRNLGEASGDAA